MNRFKRINLAFVFNVVVILILLLLPYYLFRNKFFIGGDDSQLGYVFPNLFLQRIQFSSWNEFSNIGGSFPNQFLVPLLILVYIVQHILPWPVLVEHLFYSLPLIMGFFYTRKLLNKLLLRNSNTPIISIIGSLLYVFSPILVQNQYQILLYSTLLIGYIPFVLYYFYLYYEFGRWKDILIVVLVSMIFSPAIFAISWWAGFLLPILVIIPFYLLLYSKNEIIRFVKRSSVFFSAIIFSQSFWFVQFISTIFSKDSNGLGGQVLSSQTAGTFIPTVLATSKGTIIYPLINLFHRKIAFDFNWQLKNVFLNYYDKITLLDFIYPILILISLIYLKEVLTKEKKRFYVLTFFVFLLELFFFTVNIGYLKEVFLYLGHIPGFVMFRNPFDKFAPGYSFYYAIVLAFSLNIILIKFPKIAKVTFVLIFLLILINVAPIKSMIDRPLWTTQDIYQTTSIPDEYIKFANNVGNILPKSTDILNIPFNISSYSIIKDSNSNNIYAGRTIFKLFSGINDFGGTLSFPSLTSNIINQDLLNRNYDNLKNLLSIYNIRYILSTNNIPSEVLNSYLFNQDVLNSQDIVFKQNILGKEVLSSSNNNYQLFKVDSTESVNGIITIPNNIYTIQDDDITADQFQSLLGFINDDNVLLNNFNHTEYSHSLYSLEPGVSTQITSGTDHLYINNNSIGSLTYTNNNVYLNNTPEYILDGKNEFSEGKLLFNVPNDQDDIINVDQDYIDATESTGFAVNEEKPINLLKSTENNLISTSKASFQSWSEGDCNSYESKAVQNTFNFDNDFIQLNSLNSHNACIYNKVLLKPNTVYEIKFDYQTNAKNLGLYLGFDDGNPIIKNLNTNTGQQNFKYIFNSGDNSYVRLYLYSGESSGISSTTYKNLDLSSYEIAQQINPSSQNINADIQVFNKESSFLLADPKNILTNSTNFSDWSQGDCAAINNTPSVTFLNQNTNTVELQASNGHNACIYKDYAINDSNVYTLEFDVNSPNINNLIVYIGFNGKFSPITMNIPINIDSWNHISQPVQIPKGASEMLVYLYSGVNVNGTSTSLYKNFTLTTLPKNYYQNFLITEPLKNIKDPISFDYTKITDYAYKVTFNSVSDSFLFNFLESYHSGWKLYYFGSSYKWYSVFYTKPIDLNHYMANDYSNAWWFDLSKVCSQKTFCNKNADGTYNVTLLIYFEPQIWFYIGSIISLLVLIVVLLLFFIKKNIDHHIENNNKIIYKNYYFTKISNRARKIKLLIWRREVILLILVLIGVSLAFAMNLVVAVFAVLFFAFLFFEFDPVLMAQLSLFFLCAIFLLLLFKKQSTAELVAVYMYYLLIMFVTLQVKEFVKEKYHHNGIVESVNIDHVTNIQENNVNDIQAPIVLSESEITITSKIENNQKTIIPNEKVKNNKIITKKSKSIITHKSGLDSLVHKRNSKKKDKDNE